MSTVNVYNARDPTESMDTRDEQEYKKITIDTKRVGQGKKNSYSKNKKSKTVPISNEEEFLDELEYINSPIKQKITKSENQRLDKQQARSIKKRSKKDKYKDGVVVATELITVILEHHGEINENSINAVLASLLCRKETVATSSKGKKVLKKATRNDHSFVAMAMLAAESVKDLDGSIESMKKASASVLACRRLKQYNDFRFERSHLLAISKAAAQDAVLNEERSTKIEEDIHSKEPDEMSYDYETATDDQSDASVTLAVTSFDSIEHIRSGGLRAWRENLGECFSYGFAEVLGCLGNQLVQASDKTTKQIEETVINDYLIQNGIESYGITGELASWKPWVSEEVDFVELEIKFEKYFYTVSTAKGSCTLEWPSGKKILKQKKDTTQLKYGKRRLASSEEAMAEIGIQKF